MKKAKTAKIVLIIFAVMFLFFGCGAQVYMLDAPVNDPIMFARENQNSDLSRVEDGSYTGSAGECPT
ncbi:MAG: hypothetical protein GY863_20045 [bacterium]|nr:hypothetical protein [bacterium]